MIDRTKPWYSRKLGWKRVLFILVMGSWVQDVVGYQFAARLHLPFNRTAGLFAAIITLTILVWLGTQVD